jgi:hypothetical protein
MPPAFINELSAHKGILWENFHFIMIIIVIPNPTVTKPNLCRCSALDRSTLGGRCGQHSVDLSLILARFNRDPSNIKSAACLIGVLRVKAVTVIQQLVIGKIVKAARDIPLTRNIHVTVLSGSTPLFFRKGSEAEVVAITPQHIDLNCKDGHGLGPAAWGLRIRVAKVAWWNSFE